MRVSLQQIATMCNLPCVGLQGKEELIISSVCRDTKDVTPGALFVCIEGARFDGHDFAAQAVQDGAVALLVSRPLPDLAVPQWVAEDTVVALGALAQAWRHEFVQKGGKVVAVTGSAGKTTVKEVLADVLAASGKKVARNILNFNNQIGMPLSVLATSGEEDIWVMEVGISQAHDMDILGAILQPHVALVLNVGAAHTEGLGEQGVAHHKSRLLAHVLSPQAGGRAFVSADYADLSQKAHEIFPAVQYFSAENAPEATYTATYLGRVRMGKGPGLNATEAAEATGGKGKYAVRKALDGSGAGQRFEVLAPFYGSYGAENVAAIVAVAEALGLDMYHVQQGFLQAALPQQRFHAQSVGAWHIIDDSYNANPLSMKRMLLAAMEMAQAEHLPCYAVLGAMGELGAEAEKEHASLGVFLAQSGIQDIFWTGSYGDVVHKAMRQEGYAGTFVQVKNVSNFTHHWSKRRLRPGYVLCKGSRSNKLEELVDIIHIYAREAVSGTAGSEHAL